MGRFNKLTKYATGNTYNEEPEEETSVSSDMTSAIQSLLGDKQKQIEEQKEISVSNPLAAMDDRIKMSLNPEMQGPPLPMVTDDELNYNKDILNKVMAAGIAVPVDGILGLPTGWQNVPGNKQIEMAKQVAAKGRDLAKEAGTKVAQSSRYQRLKSLLGK